MFYIDTPTAQIDALDFAPSTGEVSGRRPVVKGFDFDTTGFPDGSGALLAEVRVPKEAGRQVTSAAFGGDDLQDLYLTTAREGFDEAKGKEFPLLGVAKLRELGLEVQGQPPNHLKLGTA
eukprot:Skav223175  [mRNA]  locus=scaffold2044:148751:151308:+ [translate_table: standard]